MALLSLCLFFFWLFSSGTGCGSNLSCPPATRVARLWPGHLWPVRSHTSRDIFHISFCPGSSHENRIRFMSSRVPQQSQQLRCSCSGMFFRYLPTLLSPCIVLHKKSAIGLLIALSLSCFHILIGSGGWPVSSFILLSIAAKFSSDVGVCSARFRLCIPLYAEACVILASSAPVRWNPSAGCEVRFSNFIVPWCFPCLFLLSEFQVHNDNTHQVICDVGGLFFVHYQGYYYGLFF